MSTRSTKKGFILCFGEKADQLSCYRVRSGNKSPSLRSRRFKVLSPCALRAKAISGRSTKLYSLSFHTPKLLYSWNAKCDFFCCTHEAQRLMREKLDNKVGLFEKEVWLLHHNLMCCRATRVFINKHLLKAADALDAWCDIRFNTDRLPAAAQFYASRGWAPSTLKKNLKDLKL